MLGSQRSAIGQDHRALHDVSKLPHVSNPVMVEQELQDPVRYRFDSFPLTLAELMHEACRQQKEVVTAIGEARKPDVHHGQPVIEVLSEPAGLDRCAKIL